MVVKRFGIYLVNLDSTVGREIKKTRPCLVVSPDEMNRHIQTLVVAPMMEKGISYPTRIGCRFHGQDGKIIMDQIRTVDKNRLVKFRCRVSPAPQKAVLETLREMFSE